MSDISNYVRRGRNVDREDINKLLGLITPVAFAEPEDEGIQERIVVTPATRKRTSTSSTGLDIEDSSGNKERLTGDVTMQLPSVCQAFPFTQITTGALTYEKNQGSKYGSGGIFDGTNDYLELDNIVGSDLDLEITDAFSIGTWFKANTISAIPSIVTKATGYANEAGYKFYTGSTGRLAFKISNGATSWSVVITTPEVDDNAWHSLFATYDGTSNQDGINVYIDKTLEGTGATSTITGSMKNTETLNVGSDSGGTSKLTGSLAWTVMMKEELTQAWINAYHDNGFLDFSGGNLIWYAPFYGRDAIYGEARASYCVAS